MLTMEDPATLSISDIIEREQAAGQRLGPFHKQWLLERSPERVQRYLRLAREHPHVYGMPEQSFSAPVLGFGGVATAPFAAINTSLAELNMIGATQAIINQYCAIPSSDVFAGKVYRVEMGGVYGNTGTPTVIFTPRWGSSTTPATNISLGANAAFTTITGTTALPYFVSFTFTIRTSPPGATLGTGYGTGFVKLQIPVTSSQVTADILIGGTAATIDTSGQGTAGCGLTMNLTWSASSVSNTQTCNWFLLTSLN